MYLIHALACCDDCGKSWDSRNAMGVAAQHHRKYGHSVRVEVVYAHRFGAREEPKQEKPSHAAAD